MTPSKVFDVTKWKAIIKILIGREDEIISIKNLTMKK